MTRNLFEKPDAPAGAGATTISATTSVPTATAAKTRSNPSPSLELLTGTWKGDKNIDRVTILPDGRGFAVLASGTRMSLRVSIEGTTAIVSQDQPNSPDFYRPGLDPKSARIVAQGARPWRWKFSLSTDGNSMTGVKESVFVTVDKTGAVSLDNNYVRDAVWTRLYR
jgi:hypothetical protein